ncbi:MAG: putative dehydrogenase related protein [Halonotius sp. J07HN6]|nr:MAG: putative dehydrogenase related protein [Halonotius sp. J07HN6]
MAMAEPLTVGMIGYGFMGRAHANALARLPMFFPDAPAVTRDTLVGRDESALGEAADRLGFERTATDWRDVVGDVDVLYNLAPNHLHAEPSIAALEAGTAVLCEKPLATTREGAESMASAAADADVPACIGFNYRFVPAIQYARRLIDAGEIGEITQFRGRYLQDWLVDPDAPWSWRLDDDRAGSGALGDLGAHTVDLARFLVGDRTGGIDRVSGNLRTFTTERPVASEGDETTGDAETTSDDETASDDESTTEHRPVTVDDAFTAQLGFANGAVGTVEASRVAAGHKNDHTIEIHGTEGSLRFSLERLNELDVHTGDSRGYETVLVTEESDPYLDRWWPPGHVLGWEHTFVHESYEFLTSVADSTTGESTTGSTPTVPSFADGAAVQRVLDGIERAAEAETWVDLDATTTESVRHCGGCGGRNRNGFSSRRYPPDMASSSVSGFEMVITVGMGAVTAAILVGSDIFPATLAIPFVSMVLIGFIASRTVLGRRWSWR